MQFDVVELQAAFAEGATPPGRASLSEAKTASKTKPEKNPKPFGLGFFLTSMCRFPSAVCIVSVASMAITMMFMSCVLHFVFPHHCFPSASSGTAFFIILIADETGDTQDDDKEQQ